MCPRDGIENPWFRPLIFKDGELARDDFFSCAPATSAGANSMQPRLVSTRSKYVFCTDLPVFLVEFGAWETGQLSTASSGFSRSAIV